MIAMADNYEEIKTFQQKVDTPEISQLKKDKTVEKLFIYLFIY